MTGTGRAYVGGFSGVVVDNIEHCFATGNVIVERNNASNNEWTRVSGFGGYLKKSTSHNAALGTSVTVIGAPSNEIGRIYGETDVGGNNNNHAYNGMRLYHTRYIDSRPTEISLSPAPTASNRHGADATIGDIRGRSFWETTLGFSPAAWDFTYVGLKGYPRLKDKNGWIMEGQ
jgi:hypothetical protein